MTTKVTLAKGPDCEMTVKLETASDSLADLLRAVRLFRKDNPGWYYQESF